MSKNNQEVLAELVRLAKQLGDDTSPSGGPTFAEIWRRYWREEGRGNGTADDTERRGRLMLAFVAERSAMEVTTELAEDYRDVRKDPRRCEALYAQAGVSFRKSKPRPATINRELATTRRALQWAVENRLLSSNPLWTVRMEAEDNIKSSKIRSEEELQKLLALADPYMRAAVLIGVDSGTRRMEFLSLTWEQISVVTTNGVKQPIAELWKTKNGQRRRIGLTWRTYEALQALPKVDRYIFVGREPGRYRGGRGAGRQAPIRPGTHLRPDSFNQRFKRLCGRAGVWGPDGKPLTLHALRHSFAYLGRVVYKLPEQSLMKQGGWKTRSAFDRYGIGGEEELASMYQHINQRISEEQERLDR